MQKIRCFSGNKLRKTEVKVMLCITVKQKYRNKCLRRAKNLKFKKKTIKK